MLIAGSVLAAASLFGLAAGPGPAVAVGALAVSGIAYGALAVAYPVASARYYGADRTAGVYARVFTAWGVAGVTAPVAAGALYDRTGGYGTMLVILGAGSIAGRGRERGARRCPRGGRRRPTRSRGSRSRSCRRP